MPQYTFKCNRCGWQGERIVHFTRTEDSKKLKFAIPPKKLKYAIPPQACDQILVLDTDGLPPSISDPGAEIEKIAVKENLGREVTFASGPDEGRVFEVKACDGELSRVEQIEMTGMTPYAWRP